MKRIYLFGWIVIFVLLVFPTRVSATEGDDIKYSHGNFYYHLHDGYVSICGYLGSDMEITIPSNIAGKPVAEIEAMAFNGCDSIQVITIPDTVEKVYDNSFAGMRSLCKIISYTVGVEIRAIDGVEIVSVLDQQAGEGKKDNHGGEGQASEDGTGEGIGGNKAQGEGTKTQGEGTGGSKAQGEGTGNDEKQEENGQVGFPIGGDADVEPSSPEGKTVTEWEEDGEIGEASFIEPIDGLEISIPTDTATEIESSGQVESIKEEITLSSETENFAHDKPFFIQYWFGIVIAAVVLVGAVIYVVRRGK